MNRYLPLGVTVLAGAALFEAALVPGIVLGGAAILAARYASKQLPNVGRLLRPASLASKATRRRSARAKKEATNVDAVASSSLPQFRIKQAIAKTITFRIIVSTLDFTTNYVVIGELNTAAGLSAFALVVGPVFYLAHETAWNYFGPSGADAGVPIRLPLRLPLPRGRQPTLSRA